MSTDRPENEPDHIDAELEALLTEAESTVARLRAGLQLSRERRATEQQLADQHAEIDRLREHLSTAQVHWGEVRTFLEEALHELTGRDRPDGEDSHDEQGPKGSEEQ